MLIYGNLMQVSDVVTSNLATEASFHVTFLRLLRLVRLVRILRALRVLKLIVELRSMLSSIAGSHRDSEESDLGSGGVCRFISITSRSSKNHRTKS